MPIGNLTSQIFANIYFNEFDRYVSHTLKPLGYLRYGDDFLLFCTSRAAAHHMRKQATRFLQYTLGLEINPKTDKVRMVRHGIHFLGTRIFPSSKVLDEHNWRRSQQRLSPRNVASYRGLVQQHGSYKHRQTFDWVIGQHHGQL